LRGHISTRQSSKSTCLECKRLSGIKLRAKGKPNYHGIAVNNSLKTGIPLVSREDASLLGEVHYFTGIPCHNGHVAKRTVSGFACVICAKHTAKKWRAMNPEKAVETQRRFRASDSHSAYMLKTSTLARRRRQNSERKRNIKSAIPVWETMKAISDYYEDAVIQDLTVDHLVPITSDFVCGLHTCDNFQIIDAIENSKKGNRYWPEMSDTNNKELLRMVEEFNNEL